MNPLLWAVAVMLAIVFVITGWPKLRRTRQEIVIARPSLDPLPLPVLRLTGALEILGALGIVLPPVIGGLGMLVPWAALGLAVLMILAAGLNLRAGQTAEIPLNVVLALAALALAAARFWLAPFA